MDEVLYLPIATTVLAAVFATAVLRRWWQRGRPPHLGWWGAGILLFGVGTFFEGFTAVFGWEAWLFRGWYISGALLGGAPLAQGTVYLLLRRRTAHALAAALVAVVVVASVFVLLTPLDAGQAEEHRLTTDVIEWTWVRGFSPFINTYAFIFLVGGAIVSALHYRDQRDQADRMWGNLAIAIGGILPGIGGSFTRAGYTEVLYVTEFIGLWFIYAGFLLNTRSRSAVKAESDGRLHGDARNGTMEEAQT